MGCPKLSIDRQDQPMRGHLDEGFSLGKPIDVKRRRSTIATPLAAGETEFVRVYGYSTGVLETPAISTRN